MGEEYHDRFDELPDLPGDEWKHAEGWSQYDNKFYENYVENNKREDGFKGLSPKDLFYDAFDDVEEYALDCGKPNFSDLLMKFDGGGVRGLIELSMELDPCEIHSGSLVELIADMKNKGYVIKASSSFEIVPSYRIKL